MTRTTQALVVIIVIALSGCRTWEPPPPVKASRGDARPVIHSPKDQQWIGEEGDPLCPKGAQPCIRIRAEGWVPVQRIPFFAVEPVLASPQMWIQPPIHVVKQDGSFSGLIYLGEEQNGAKEYFKIYIFACADRERFREGEVLLQMPGDCEVSEPVEVYRER